MRLKGPIVPLIALAATALVGPAQADEGDQLAALVPSGVQPRLLLNAKEAPVDLAYDVRRSRPAVGERVRARAFTAIPRAEASIDALGLPLQGDGALVDLYPFRQGFRITAGARADLSDARFLARSRRGTAESDKVIAATLTSRDDGFVPYVGIGYGRRMLDGRLEVAVDAGVLFDREQDSEGLAQPSPAALSVEAGSSGPGEDESESSSEVYPVIGFSMKYQF